MMARRLLFVLPAAASAASAQCVMCARTAAAQSAARVDVLLQGVLILLAGPLLIGGALALLAWKRKGPGAGHQGCKEHVDPAAPRLRFARVPQKRRGQQPSG